MKRNGLGAPLSCRSTGCDGDQGDLGPFSRGLVAGGSHELGLNPHSVLGVVAGTSPPPPGLPKPPGPRQRFFFPVDFSGHILKC